MQGEKKVLVQPTQCCSEHHVKCLFGPPLQLKLFKGFKLDLNFIFENIYNTLKEVTSSLDFLNWSECDF